MTKTGIELITEERQRQIEVEGWTPEHDDQHDAGELARAAAWYAIPNNQDEYHPLRNWLSTMLRHHRDIWPWDWEWWKPTPDDRIRELVKAGALIVAEIDRIQRIEKKQ